MNDEVIQQSEVMLETMQDATVMSTPPSPSEIVADFHGLGDVEVEVTAVLGTAQLPIEQFLKLGRGAIIELEQNKESPISVLVNGYPFAWGEVQVLDNKIGFSIVEVIDHSKDLE